MATRTIVTSQPDVACDVCERRLLRGEQHDIFLAAGRRRTVCELCAPRAAHEGWMRERDNQSVTLPPMRPRRGRSFIDRLRQVGRPPGSPAGEAAETGTQEGRRDAPSYDFLDGYGDSGSGRGRERAKPAGVPTLLPDGSLDAVGEAGDPAPAQPATYIELGAEVFNASEFPRRVAGVARSLGAPAVNIRSAEHLESVVVIVVAWELCWYRYEVDLSVEPVEARVMAQGTELSELAPEERDANAFAEDSGAIRV